VQGEISETNALKLLKGDYHLRIGEVPADGEQMEDSRADI